MVFLLHWQGEGIASISSALGKASTRTGVRALRRAVNHTGRRVMIKSKPAPTTRRGSLSSNTPTSGRAAARGFGVFGAQKTALRLRDFS